MNLEVQSSSIINNEQTVVEYCSNLKSNEENPNRSEGEEQPDCKLVTGMEMDLVKLLSIDDGVELMVTAVIVEVRGW